MMEQGNELCTWRTNRSPFFSVIVPVYNVAPYLGECLDSVLAQTFTDWECLCTDDGSKDGSDLILDAYARRDPRFRVTHQPNAGVSAARNRALDRICGKWVWFVDGDDRLLDNVFVRLCETPGFGECDILVFSYLEEMANGNTCVSGVTPFFGIFAKVFAGNLARALKFERYPMGEDILFLLRAYVNVNGEQGVRYLREPLYFYRWRQGSAVRLCFTHERAMLSLDVAELELRLACEYACLSPFREWLMRALYISRVFFFYSSGIVYDKAVFRRWVALMEAVPSAKAGWPAKRYLRTLLWLTRKTMSPLVFRVGILWAHEIQKRIIWFYKSIHG